MLAKFYGIIIEVYHKENKSKKTTFFNGFERNVSKTLQIIVFLINKIQIRM